MVTLIRNQVVTLVRNTLVTLNRNQVVSLSGISNKELKMGLALIEQYTEPMDLAKYKDEYHNELLKIIEQKAKGKRPTIKKLKPKAAKSDDLYDQLMSSLNVKKGA